MLNYFGAIFNKSSSVEAPELKKSNIIYRDELSKRPTTNKPKKGKVRFDISEPLLKKEAGEKTCGERRRWDSAEEKGVIRVKVKMTKQEAERMLAKCNEGGVLQFRDVASELTKIPINRVNVLLPRTSTVTMLKSIPEEL